MSEFDIEPIPGLPERPPEGERILWQGKPAAWPLAKRALHARKVALYFLVVGSFLAVDALWGGESLVMALGQGLSQFVIGTIAVGVLCVLAWLMSRTTVYTITNRRVVARFGVALPITVNLPFTMLESADLRLNGDGTGDISLTMAPDQKISYMLFWPHVRPWHLSSPKPSLRAIPDAEEVAGLFAETLTATQGLSGPRSNESMPSLDEASTPIIHRSAAGQN
ncbi:hypothetical protein J2T57_003014 [Natronocella acetinitrilica]|uniref:YdbS-like PH domain-containing protein n=1 Tax=Natronocella acetinitrilica TaxID=414046 RepID=A0AAE3KCI5_9GAMM|nr:hypothetical protein [Natronocella acetinitrilica]